MKSQDEECKCIKLPTGEKIRDPIGCQLTIKEATLYYKYSLQ